MQNDDDETRADEVPSTVSGDDLEAWLARPPSWAWYVLCVLGLPIGAVALLIGPISFSGDWLFGGAPARGAIAMLIGLGYVGAAVMLGRLAIGARRGVVLACVVISGLALLVGILRAANPSPWVFG